MRDEGRPKFYEFAAHPVFSRLVRGDDGAPAMKAHAKSIIDVRSVPIDVRAERLNHALRSNVRGPDRHAPLEARSESRNMNTKSCWFQLRELLAD